MKASYSGCHAPQQQKGAVLLIALIFLIILTLLGLSSMDSTILETKMAHNAKEKNWALQVAEMGLLQGSTVVEALSEDDTSTQTMMKTGLYPNTANITDIQRDAGITAETKNTQIRYIGRYPFNKASSTGMHSKLKVQAVYFATTSTGLADSELNTEMTLSNGIRQLVPATD